MAVHSRLHSFNNLHEFWGDAAVTGQEGGTEADNLTKEDIQRVAKKTFKDSNRTVGMIETETDEEASS